MSIEERDDAQQSRPRKVIPGINREGAGQDGDRRAYGNAGYNRSEGNNFERRQYNRQPQNDRGGNNYRSYDRPSYNDYGLVMTIAIVTVLTATIARTIIATMAMGSIKADMGIVSMEIVNHLTMINVLIIALISTTITNLRLQMR